jgi:hypothetical protein
MDLLSHSPHLGVLNQATVETQSWIFNTILANSFSWGNSVAVLLRPSIDASMTIKKRPTKLSVPLDLRGDSQSSSVFCLATVVFFLADKKLGPKSSAVTRPLPAYCHCHLRGIKMVPTTSREEAMKVCVPISPDAEFRIRRASWISAIIFTAYFLPTCVGASAQTALRLYNTERVIGPIDRGCNGAPNCTVVSSPTRTIPTKKLIEIDLACPKDSPNIWGWDTQQHEHLIATLSRSAANSLSVVVMNDGDKAGSVTVFAGCSTTVRKSSWHQQSRRSIPTGAAALQGR